MAEAAAVAMAAIIAPAVIWEGRGQGRQWSRLRHRMAAAGGSPDSPLSSFPSAPALRPLPQSDSPPPRCPPTPPMVLPRKGRKQRGLPSAGSRDQWPWISSGHRTCGGTCDEAGRVWAGMRVLCCAGGKLDKVPGVLLSVVLVRDVALGASCRECKRSCNTVFRTSVYCVR